jgi:hypothetical protein
MRTKCVVAAVGLSLLLAGPSLAGVLNGHADAWMGWTGTTPMANGALSGTVDWAVFWAPDYPGTYAHDADEFIYAYQVIVDGTAPVTQLTVNMIDSNEANDIDVDASIAAGTQSPYFYDFGAPPPDLQTANWFFAGMVASDESPVLVYSSVNMPLWDHGAYIYDNGLWAYGPLPTPSDVIPEPATLALVGLGFAGLAARRRR